MTNRPILIDPNLLIPGEVESRLAFVENDPFIRLGQGTQHQVVAADSRGLPEWVGGFTAYTPTWASSGTAPSIGNGTIVGRYLRLNDLVFASIVLTTGSTTSIGTGTYRLTLPVNYLDSSPSNTIQGTTALHDQGGSKWYGWRAGLTNSGDSVNAVNFDEDGAALVFWSDTAPGTWGDTTGDIARVTIWYEAA